MSKGTIWGKLFFGEERNFSRILYSEQRDSGILIQNSCKVVKIAFYVSRLTFWGIFSKKYHFFQHFRKMSKKLSNYGPKISGRFFKSFHLKSLDKHLEDFLKKVQFFHHFWTLSSKIYPTFAENLPQAWQKCIIGVKGNILKKNNLSEKNTCFFWSFLNFQPIFVRKFDKNNSTRVPNFIFCVYRGRVTAKFFLENKNIFFWCS